MPNYVFSLMKLKIAINATFHELIWFLREIPFLIHNVHCERSFEQGFELFFINRINSSGQRVCDYTSNQF